MKPVGRSRDPDRLIAQTLDTFDGRVGGVDPDVGDLTDDQWAGLDRGDEFVGLGLRRGRVARGRFRPISTLTTRLLAGSLNCALVETVSGSSLPNSRSAKAGHATRLSSSKIRASSATGVGFATSSNPGPTSSAVGRIVLSSSTVGGSPSVAVVVGAGAAVVGGVVLGGAVVGVVVSGAASVVATTAVVLGAGVADSTGVDGSVVGEASEPPPHAVIVAAKAITTATWVLALRRRRGLCRIGSGTSVMFLRNPPAHTSHSERLHDGLRSTTGGCG